MQAPSILQGESRTRLLQGIAIGAIASIAIGFSWGGWMTSRTANTLAAEHAENAVVAALTPICVAKFLQASDAEQNLAALQKISSNWEQGQYVEKGGWATRPGASSPDYLLGRACADKLVQAKTAVQWAVVVSWPGTFLSRRPLNENDKPACADVMRRSGGQLGSASSRAALNHGGALLDTMFNLPNLEGVEEVVISLQAVDGAMRPRKHESEDTNWGG
jgi:pimeloyl-ACP methyl ester carboxylesterase